MCSTKHPKQLLNSTANAESLCLNQQSGLQQGSVEKLALDHVDATLEEQRARHVQAQTS